MRMGRRGEGWVGLQLLAGLAVLAVAIAAPGWGGLRIARLAAAAVVAAGGIAVGLAAARALGHALTPFPRPVPGAPLARTGPYRRVRHPIYSAVIALALSVTLAGSPWALIPTAMMIVVLDLKARREEVWLTEVRRDYAEFCAEVPWRFFPGLR